MVRFSDAKRSRHSEIPLESGVKTAGLALMGAKSTKAAFQTKNSQQLRCRIPRYEKAKAGALLIWLEQLKIDICRKGAPSTMPATGELIRMMNYVDDIAATVRRIQVGITGMTAEERKRLADYMRSSDPSFMKTLENLEKS
jgi:hypothetical protein